MSTPHSDDLDGTSPSYLLNASSHRRMRSLLNLRSVSFILVLIVSLVFLSVDRFMRPLAFLPALIRPSYFNNTTTRAFSNPTAASCFSTSSHTLANMGRTREPVVASGAKTDAELTDREKKEWNHLADMMERYHNHFKHNFHAIYQVSYRFSSHPLDLLVYINLIDPTLLSTIRLICRTPTSTLKAGLH
jgi:hypothetical protein